ncbi:hypothetical protein [Geothrix mesophila]|uniref:hypothetical protein n=1 Tax=Geothrix mesophila TaxID=2922723 RepID=UPI001FAB9F5B|nr:hypothetical protein [Geothrix sp. SG198]
MLGAMKPALFPVVALLVLPAMLALSGCAKPETGGLSGAATAPLGDLNLVRAKIPPILLAAQKAPYGPPTDPTCAGLVAEVRQLDAALPPDLDAPPTADPSLGERGRAEASGAAVGAVRHTTEGLIPFRGWVRKLSGAERHSRLVAEAVAAGLTRRAYLKGLGQAQGCPPPAAPRRAEPAASAPLLPGNPTPPPSR